MAQLNSYKDLQDLVNRFVTDNLITLEGSPHGAFWNDLTYDQFVDDDVPGVRNVKILVRGNSAESNLIKILKGPLAIGGRSIRRMPGGGPFMSDEMIASIADWIDRNCPNPLNAMTSRLG